ncbi:hypothetical protein CDL12_06423 [Handroanthus impetiginosus]|uniref:Bulb-type lectin domain-containing protein n=1 Tax=Handroanthus impetiginosus TaxID=429701 RepID=A0A2G9HTM1_9LAMI|nr:hypothetical protein CDL12_06423 [Handroanthus impetiginosus]
MTRTIEFLMGTVRYESSMHWVWEANRGNPVGENATFPLGANGNLVLTVANKGVLGFKLLPNGNMVPYGSEGNFVWQSFDYAADTLLVGQSLHLKGQISSKPETDDAFAYELRLESQDKGNRILSRPKYNSELTYLRLEIDGGLRAYTFYDKVDYDSVEECQLLDRRGEFGVCEDSQHVACPSPNGLFCWSNNRAPPQPKSWVDHFPTKYTRGNGPVKEEEWSRKCTPDCMCLGFFFNRAEFRCWIVYDLKILTKVETPGLY